MTKFSQLGLSPEVLKAVAETGYENATPIQEQAIPVALAGRDVLGIAQTGTGKTAAFTLPMIERLAAGRSKARMPRSVVLCPTRELADQVAAAFEKYAKYHRLSWALLIGGVSMADQVAKLTRGVDVLIATPGRLLDLFERSKVLLTGVQIMVVDEADRMLDMGFIPDIERIFKLTPPSRQTLFFSATMPPEITRLTTQFLKDPTRIEVARPASTNENIAQHVVRIPSGDPRAKRMALRALIEKSEVTNGIVFCNRKTDVDIVAKSLVRHGFDAGPIHGDLDQSVRMKTLEGFRNGNLRLLVASDVAARGLDIPAVGHVFNYDVPYHPDDYVHRIGRTGRAGRTGEAFMIVSPEDVKNLDKVLKLIKVEPNELTLDLEWADTVGSERVGRGRDRDRKGGGGRAERPDRRRPRLDAEEAAAPAEREPETLAPRRDRDPGQARRRREPRDAEGTPAPAVEPEITRVAPAAATPPRRAAAREDRHDRSPVGFGADTPAFLLRTTGLAPIEDLKPKKARR